MRKIAVDVARSMPRHSHRWTGETLIPIKEARLSPLAKWDKPR
jgi:hypothetical protein